MKDLVERPNKVWTSVFYCIYTSNLPATSHAPPLLHTPNIKQNLRALSEIPNKGIAMVHFIGIFMGERQHRTAYMTLPGKCVIICACSRIGFARSREYCIRQTTSPKLEKKNSLVQQNRVSSLALVSRKLNFGESRYKRPRLIHKVQTTVKKM